MGKLAHKERVSAYTEKRKKKENEKTIHQIYFESLSKNGSKLIDGFAAIHSQRNFGLFQILNLLF